MRLLAALCCCLALSAQAEIFSARVIVVMDGDTVMVLREGGSEIAGSPPASSLRGSRERGHYRQKIKVRLANVDAPEEDQPFGKESRDSMLQMVGKKQVQIESLATDQYGRTIGLIMVDGLDVSQEQVKRGMAWEYSLRHENRLYIQLQKEAQQEQRGLWAQPGHMAPWRWRKIHPPVKPDIQTRRDSSSNIAATREYDLACGDKSLCSQMISCDEARFYFERCGVQTLDGNHDGIPCERLCSTALH